MSETFACPQCGKSYLHADRKPGKAVICVCGHRFLVPAPEVRAARPEPQLHAPRGEQPPEPRAKSPVEAIPPARPASPRPAAPIPSRPAPPRRAPQAPPEMVAEVVYPGDSAKALPAAEIVAAPYALDAAALPAYDSFAAPPPVARRASRSSTASSELFGLWLGRVVLFIVVPLSMLCVVIAHIQMHRNGGIARFAARRQAGLAARLSPARQPAAPAAGNLLNITGASMRNQNGAVEFSLHFARGGFVPQPSDRYFWIVTSDQGNVELTVHHTALTTQGALVGKPTGSAAQRLRQPMTTWIESQAVGSPSRQRISNEFKF